ncbi:MAG: hypothetical protein ACKN9T_03505, partial [Candidatus Methylumidiphilus sp.]
MNKPLKALQSGADTQAPTPSAHIIHFNFALSKVGQSILPGQADTLSLSGFRDESNTDDKRRLDYLLIGLLTVVAHFYLVQWFQNAARNAEPLTPVKVPPMVQITLTPPPKPIVQPPPPPPPPPPPKKVEPPPKKLDPPKKVAPPPPKKVAVPPPAPRKDVVALKPHVAKPRPVIEREPPPPQHYEPVDDDPPPAPVKAAP